MTTRSHEAFDAARMFSCAALLSRARARIAAPQSHARGAMARSADGREVAPSDPEAVAWCFTGALFAEPLAEHGARESHLDAWAAVQHQIDPTESPSLTVSAVNDGPDGHRRILAYVDAAIARLRRQS